MSNDELLETIKAMQKRIGELERQSEAQEKQLEAQAEKVKEVADRGPSQGGWFNRIDLSGAVEVEASHASNFDNSDASDIALATVELGVEADVYDDWVKAQVVLLHEDDDTEPMEVDQGILTIGNAERHPLYFAGGRMYVPFGNFESNLVSDPLTLEIAETREAALQLGFETGRFYGSAFVFNGSTAEGSSGVDTPVEHYGANLGFAGETGGFEFDVGAAYVNTIADSDSLQDLVEGNVGTMAGGADNTALARNVAGFGVYGILNLGSFNFIGEYIAALDSFDPAEMDFSTVGGAPRGAEPKAWNLEAGYHFQFFKRDSTFAVAWQGTDEALGLGLPERRWLVGLGIGIYDHTTLSVEWAHDDDYATTENDTATAVAGTGNDADTVTVQIAVDF